MQVLWVGVCGQHTRAHGHRTRSHMCTLTHTQVPHSGAVALAESLALGFAGSSVTAEGTRAVMQLTLFNSCEVAE